MLVLTANFLIKTFYTFKASYVAQVHLNNQAEEALKTSFNASYVAQVPACFAK